jgi:hypothetical protein
VDATVNAKEHGQWGLFQARLDHVAEVIVFTQPNPERARAAQHP